MTKAAFSHSAEAEGRRLKNIRPLAKYQSRMLIFKKKLLSICFDSILFADLILTFLIFDYYQAFHTVLSNMGQVYPHIYDKTKG